MAPPPTESLTAHWQQRFETLLRRCVGPAQFPALQARCPNRFGLDYRSRVRPAVAVRDCLNIERLGEACPDILDLGAGRSGERGERLQWISRCDRPLDECIPMLEHAGLRVIDQTRFIDAAASVPVHLRSFLVQARRVSERPLRASRRRLLATLHAVLRGEVADDPLNALVVAAGLTWNEVDVLRAYCRFAGQLGGPLRRQRIERALTANPAVGGLLLRYFAARFDPELEPRDLRDREEQSLEGLRVELAEALTRVVEVAEDRALRDLFNLIDATLRTNRYRRLRQPEAALALKFDSFGIIEMASPRPAYEIYVHAADFEGVHLRGSRVARGGIRWSDRQENLRGEILDLQQTQMIKNSLIVPQGAKGGFRLKGPLPDAEARRSAARSAYRRFIAALLDVTDAGPHQSGKHRSVVAYDDSDPYLVVAADKGTAGFSDDANEIAEREGFWLGDAFASGGTKGYNHKRFGITARGAWECVRRHFRELHRDVEREMFSVVGIGSMDGDVFGNGMLLSRNIRLIGAFSAQHIFLDPSPDPERAFVERKRLFELPNSTWADYDTAAISRGGGVFLRSATTILLAPEVREWLGVRYASVDGEGLVRLLLTAPVDLLWFGGIGTYVKGAEETNEHTGDPTNESVRVDAGELRARIIGEGANLGLTQRARVEFALRGGSINTDALDNSAGVDLSDHEVNLKILLRQLEADGRLGDQGRRDQLLEDAAAEVCAAVLAHNASQALGVSLDRVRCRRAPEAFLQLVERMAHLGLLVSERGEVPARAEVLSRSDASLTRPELAVLLARSKLALKSMLAPTQGVLAPQEFTELYGRYFPMPLRAEYGAHLGRHPLAHEITVSQIANTVIDRAGAGFLTWMDDPAPEHISRAASLYCLFDRVLGASESWERVAAAANSLSPEVELHALLAVEDALAVLCRWGLRRSRRVRLDTETTQRWRSDWLAYRSFASAAQNAPRDDPAVGGDGRVPAAGVEEAALLGEGLPSLEWVEQFPYVAELRRRSGCSVQRATETYRAVAAWFGGAQIATLIGPVAGLDRHRLAYRTIGERLLDSIGGLSLGLLRGPEGDPQCYFERLRKDGRLARVSELRRELAGASGSAVLEIMAVLAADAAAAADHVLDDLEYL